MILTPLIELLTPKQSTGDIDAALSRFSARYQMILDSGYVVSIPDNPMGIPRFTALEVIQELSLPLIPDQFLLHLNTFHTGSDLESILDRIAGLGVAICSSFPATAENACPNSPPPISESPAIP